MRSGMKRPKFKKVGMRRAKKKKVAMAEMAPVGETIVDDAEEAGQIVTAAAAPLPVVAAAPAPPDALQLELQAALAEAREDEKAELYFRKQMRRAEAARDLRRRISDAALDCLDKRAKRKDSAKSLSGYDMLNIMYKQHEKLSAARIACLEAQLEHAQMGWGRSLSFIAVRDVRIRLLICVISAVSKNQKFAGRMCESRCESD